MAFSVSSQNGQTMWRVNKSECQFSAFFSPLIYFAICNGSCLISRFSSEASSDVTKRFEEVMFLTFDEQLKSAWHFLSTSKLLPVARLSFFTFQVLAVALYLRVCVFDLHEEWPFLASPECWLNTEAEAFQTEFPVRDRPLKSRARTGVACWSNIERRWSEEDPQNQDPDLCRKNFTSTCHESSSPAAHLLQVQTRWRATWRQERTLLLGDRMCRLEFRTCLADDSQNVPRRDRQKHLSILSTPWRHKSEHKQEE